MLAIKGIYDGDQVKLLNRPPQKKKYKVIVTFVEEINEDSELRDFASKTDGLDFWLDENEDIYHGGGRGGAIGVGHLEWTAILADSDYEVEEVTKGCRVTLSYAVYLRTFGPSGLLPDPLITPSDRFLDLLAPVLNVCRGRRIAFYLTGEYGVNPADLLAESLVPYVRLLLIFLPYLVLIAFY